MSRVMTPRSGIALPLVLMLTALLAFTLFAAVSSLTSILREAETARAVAEFERQAMTAEARFVFLALSEPMGTDGLYIEGVRDAGLGRFQGFVIPELSATGVVLQMDARPYLWHAAADDRSYLAEIQDEAGLVNLYQADAPTLARLFATAGLDSDAATDLADEWINYNSDPELHQPMRRASEIYRLESASDLLTDNIWRRLSELLVAYPDSMAVNINTAPASVLQAWFDFSDDQAADIVDDRSAFSSGSGGYTSANQIGAIEVQGQAYVFPGGRMRFRLVDPETGARYSSSIVLTPDSQTRPVWVENIRIQSLKPESVSDDIEDFPQIPGLTAAG